MSTSCAGGRIVATSTRSLLVCKDCCITDIGAVIPKNLKLPKGTVMWYDGTVGQWKPLPAVIPSPLPAGFKVGLLEYDFDSTQCVPPVDGNGTIATHSATYAADMVQWPTALTAADKAKILDMFFAQALKPINYSA